jgi:hypothetical protein
LAFPTMKRELQGQNHLLRYPPKVRSSPYLHKVPSWSNKLSPWTLQTALINVRKCSTAL